MMYSAFLKELNYKNITRGIIKCSEMEENENTIHQNLWEAERAMLTRKFIVKTTSTHKKKNPGMYGFSNSSTDY